MSTSVTLPPAERDPLYQRICAFAIDEAPAAHGFANRLADDNGRPRGYTARVIAEYRKFLYLSATAGVPMFHAWYQRTLDAWPPACCSWAAPHARRPWPSWPGST
jgi:hypothetical protein